MQPIQHVHIISVILNCVLTLASIVLLLKLRYAKQMCNNKLKMAHRFLCDSSCINHVTYRNTVFYYISIIYLSECTCVEPFNITRLDKNSGLSVRCIHIDVENNNLFINVYVYELMAKVYNRSVVV